MFIHHPDGIVIINGIKLPVAFFQKMEPGYELPSAALGRSYDPGKFHVLIYSDQQIPLSSEWPEGDGYIANATTYERVYRKQQQSRPGILNRKVRRLWP